MLTIAMNVEAEIRDLKPRVSDDRVERGVRTLHEDMPKIVGDTMREVLREQRRKSRKTP